MRYAIDGGAAAGQGLGNLLGAIFQGENARQAAQQKAALQSAQAYSANMAGNKYGAEAEGLGITNYHRQQPVDTTMTPEMQTVHKLFQMGGGNAQQLGNALLSAQTSDIRNKALESVADLDMMNRYNTLAKEGATYTPFDNVGNTGRAINKATGQGSVLDATLAKLFDGVQSSAAAENYAQANNANASAGKHSAGREQILLETGVLRDTGKLPGRAGSGEDSTNAKTRNAIIAAVEKDLLGADEAEIMAEVERRLSRRGIGAGAQKPAGAPKVGTVEQGYRFKGGDPADQKNWEKM